MAKQIDELIKETHAGLSRLETELESAKATRDEYNRQLENARARLRRKERSPYPDNFTTKFIENMQKGNIPEMTLIQAIDSAIETNIEFSAEAYKKALYEVANDKTIYKYIRIGAGWQTILDFQIIFESSAGLLNEWGDAVTRYRDEVLHSKGLDNEESGVKATAWWYDNVYGTSLENKTIAGRLEMTSFKAPFWQILNSGSSPLSSDREGGYNPVPAKPTDFIGDAERAIEDQFLTMFNTEYQRWFDETSELKEVIANYEEKRNSYSYEVEQLKIDIRDNQRIYDSFGKKKEFINKNKLADVARRLRAGEEFDKATVDLSVAGSSMFRRYSLKKLEGLI